MDVALVGTVDDRGADLGHLHLRLVQVALAERVRLVVRQRRTVMLYVVPTGYLRSLLHKVLLEL